MRERTHALTVQQQEAPEQPIAPANLHHLGLKTARFKEMRAFYQTFLGVRPVLEIEGRVGFYTFDLAHHRLALFEDPSCTQMVPTSVGMHHLAFLHASIDDLMRVYQRLKRQGILPRFAMNHGPNTSLYYQDPDGNLMELLVDNFGADAGKGLEFFSQFQSNPALHGKPINPETYLMAWQQGATLAELHEQSFAGAFAEGAASMPQGLFPKQ
jgi:catechol 2,3-dioxygenase-like lactoylglutathione lyase family enzyme